MLKAFIIFWKILQKYIGSFQNVIMKKNLSRFLKTIKKKLIYLNLFFIYFTDLFETFGSLKHITYFTVISPDVVLS